MSSKTVPGDTTLSYSSDTICWTLFRYTWNMSGKNFGWNGMTLREVQRNFAGWHCPTGSALCGLLIYWFLGIGNGVGKQGSRQSTPYRQYGPDTEIQFRPLEPHGLAKPSRILSKREADTEFQYRPHILSGPVLRDAARLSQRYPPIARYGVCWCPNMTNWVRYPLPLF